MRNYIRSLELKTNSDAGVFRDVKVEAGVSHAGKGKQ